MSMMVDHAPSIRYGPDGRPYPSALEPLWGSHRADGAGLAEGSRRLNLAAWTKYDPNTREGAAPTDLGAGSGVQFSLTGGWSTTDPSTALWYIDPRPILDAFGAKLATVDTFNYVLHLVERTPPDLSSNIWVGFAIINEPTVSGTAIASLFGMHWGSATRRLQRAAITALATAGTTSASIRGFQALFSRLGIGATTGTVLFPQTNVCALNSTGGIVGSTINSGTATVAPAIGNAATTLYRAIVLLRTSAADATTRTLAVDAYEHPSAVSRLPV
jgi:hypothetical protein